MDKVVIVGSSRKDGDTALMVNEIKLRSEWDIIFLNDFKIGYYDYEHLNQNDDFIPLMRSIMGTYKTLIFATPIYWYSMSGIMKVFFDRITDLLTIEKDMGRRLRGKNMAALSVSHGNNNGEMFWLPFSKSAEYLGMNYLGHAHTIAGEDSQEIVDCFVKRINKQA